MADLSAGQTPLTAKLSEWLGMPIQDAEEETFILFSQDIPSSNLGFVDNKARTIEVEVAGRTLTLQQSPGLLNSQRTGGTTGAVQWRVTPLVAEWLSTQPCFLEEVGVLTADSTVVELGCGITGLIGITLGSKVKQYLLTDQEYVLKVLRENIQANETSNLKAKSEKHARPLKQNKTSSLLGVSIAALDWERDDASSLRTQLGRGTNVNLLIACDCIYNEHLIDPLVRTMKDICLLNSEDDPATVLFGQQLRSDTILEAFLRTLMQDFNVWRVTDRYSGTALGSDSGYVLHLAQLKSRDPTSGA